MCHNFEVITPRFGADDMVHGISYNGKCSPEPEVQNHYGRSDIGDFVNENC